MVENKLPTKLPTCHYKMFSIDSSAEKGLQSAQNLFERASSRSINPATTLVDDTQQIPSRLPPIDAQEQVMKSNASAAKVPKSIEGNASVLDSVLTKFRHQVSTERIMDDQTNGIPHKSPTRDKASSEAAKNSSDCKDFLESVSIARSRLAARVC